MEAVMKYTETIGIVGGMGSYATLDFFRRILDAFPAEKEWDRPRIVIDNLGYGRSFTRRKKRRS